MDKHKNNLLGGLPKKAEGNPGDIGAVSDGQGTHNAPAPAAPILLAVKAAGDWELDVLAIPYGSPKDRDSDGQYFTPNTKTFLEDGYKPLAVYYHGYDPNGKPQGEPEIVGKYQSWREGMDGKWIRVLLDKTKDFAKRIWEAAKKGLARASSGSLSHLVRYGKDGEITFWPLGEISLFDTAEGRQPANNYAIAVPVMKARVELAGGQMPVISEGASEDKADTKGDKQSVDATPANSDIIKSKGDYKMEANDVSKLIADALEAKTKADMEKAKVEAERKAEVEAAVKAEKAKWEEDAVKSNRLPTPAVAKFAPIWKFDNVPSADLALGIEILNESASKSRKVSPASKAMYSALAMRALEGKTEAEHVMGHALKTAGFAGKTDEVMQQDLSSYGDQWVGVGYGTELWKLIRQGTPVLDKLPTQEIPQGQETFYDPVEGADPTWYKVAESTDIDSTMKFPVASVTYGQKTTSNGNQTLAKIGARVLWSGELDEDSLVPMLPTLRDSLVQSGREMLEHLVIDGDTTDGSTTNINDSAADPAATDLFLAIDGFRHLGLVTNTDNMRSAGGSLTAADFLETAKLLGTAGGDALDVTKVDFIIDLNTHWKALQLEEVKTRDVFSAPTIENGKLARIFGYGVIPSAFMHYRSSTRKAEATGWIDQDTASDNAYGAILAVRWDQWKLGWKRRMTIETNRIANADVTEIVALLRFGLKYRSTDAAAISYNVGV
jgi:hypothetical protein